MPHHNNVDQKCWHYTNGPSSKEYNHEFDIEKLNHNMKSTRVVLVLLMCVRGTSVVFELLFQCHTQDSVKLEQWTNHKPRFLLDIQPQPHCFYGWQPLKPRASHLITTSIYAFLELNIDLHNQLTNPQEIPNRRRARRLLWLTHCWRGTWTFACIERVGGWNTHNVNAVCSNT